MRYPSPDPLRRRGPRWPLVCGRNPLPWLWDRWLRLTESRARGAAVIAAVALAVTICIFAVRPWRALAGSTWICGQESGRIARNICLGRGYSSPFATLYAARFRVDDRVEAERVRAGAPEYRGIFGPAMPADRAAAVPDPAAFAWRRPPPAPPVPTAWATPLTVYPWVALFALFGVYSPVAMAIHLVLQAAGTAAAVYLLWRLLHRELGPRPAAAGLLMLLSYPPLWTHCLVADTHNTGLFLLLLAAALTALARWRHGPGSGWLWAGGFAAALAVLAEPAIGLAIGAILIWTGLSQRQPAGEAAAPARGPETGRRAGRFIPRFIQPVVIAGVCAILVWGPWIGRNAAVFHRLVLFKSNLAMELHYGNTDDSAADPVAAYQQRFPARSERERRELLQAGEMDYGRRCREEALDFLRRRPGGAALLTVQRVLYYWTYNPFMPNPWRPALTALFWFYLFLWLTLRWKATGRRGDGVTGRIGETATGRWNHQYPERERGAETATGRNGEAPTGGAEEVEHRTPNIERRTSNGVMGETTGQRGDGATGRWKMEEHEHRTPNIERRTSNGEGTGWWLTGAGGLFLLLQPLAYYATHFIIYRYRLPLEVMLLVLVAAALRSGETATGREGDGANRRSGESATG